MASIYPVTIPKWGIEMQEGTVAEWRAAVGDTVSKGEELVDIESDKIVNTMEAPVSGILRRIIAENESTLKVGQLLAVIADADASEEAIEAFIRDFVPADASFGIGEDEAEETAPAAAADVSSEAAAASPAPSAAQTAAGAGEVRISPVARRLAKKLGVDLNTVQGTGRNGRISKEDVEAAAAAQSGASADTGAAASGGPEPIPLSGRARTAARRLVESKQAIPHFYLQRDLDARALLAAKERDGVPVTALFLKALAVALADQPGLNAHFRDDALHPRAGVDINVAVDTPEGLVAPLLRGCDRDTAAALAERLQALAQRARDRALDAEDLEAGGTTLSNLGMFGVSAFTAIINPPQVAILALGALRAGRLVPGGDELPILTATLSCDHRAIDGAAGARFLVALQQALDAL